MWDELSMADRAKYIKMGVESGITDLSTIRKVYNKFDEGGPTSDQLSRRKEVSDYTLNYDPNPPIYPIGKMPLKSAVDTYGDALSFNSSDPYENSINDIYYSKDNSLYKENLDDSTVALVDNPDENVIVYQPDSSVKLINPYDRESIAYSILNGIPIDLKYGAEYTDTDREVLKEAIKEESAALGIDPIVTYGNAGTYLDDFTVTADSMGLKKFKEHFGDDPHILDYVYGPLAGYNDLQDTPLSTIENRVDRFIATSKYLEGDIHWNSNSDSSTMETTPASLPGNPWLPFSYSSPKYINIGSLEDLVAEQSHTLQYKVGKNRNYTDAVYHNKKELEDQINNNGKRIHQPWYDDPNDYEYETHSIVEPALMDYIMNGTTSYDSYWQGTPLDPDYNLTRPRVRRLWKYKKGGSLRK